jgi:predicted nucleotidyltransferase
MDKIEALNIASKYIELLKNKYTIKSAILFGSYAKGTQHPDSDIDIAIVLTHSDDIIDTQIELMKLRRKVDLRIEPHPFNDEDFNLNNPVVDEILKNGINLQVA